MLLWAIMRKINAKNMIKALVLLGAVVFVFTYTLSPYLHNHEPDFEEHEMCPAHIIECVLTTIVIFFSVPVFLSQKVKKKS